MTTWMTNMDDTQMSSPGLGGSVGVLWGCGVTRLSIIILTFWSLQSLRVRTFTAATLRDSCVPLRMSLVSSIWHDFKCSLIRMVTLVILISGNPVLLSRSFRVNVNTWLGNYLGNWSSVARKMRRWPNPLGRRIRIHPYVGGAG